MIFYNPVLNYITGRAFYEACTFP